MGKGFFTGWRRSPTYPLSRDPTSLRFPQGLLKIVWGEIWKDLPIHFLGNVREILLPEQFNRIMALARTGISES
jgi:hypothetical protein